MSENATEVTQSPFEVVGEVVYNAATDTLDTVVPLEESGPTDSPEDRRLWVTDRYVTGLRLRTFQALQAKNDAEAGVAKLREELAAAERVWGERIQQLQDDLATARNEAWRKDQVLDRYKEQVRDKAIDTWKEQNRNGSSWCLDGLNSILEALDLDRFTNRWRVRVEMIGYITVDADSEDDAIRLVDRMSTYSVESDWSSDSHDAQEAEEDDEE